MPDYLSVKETAEILSHSEQHIRRLIRTGKIPAEKIGRQWLIPSSIIDEFDSEDGIAYNNISNHSRRSFNKAKIKCISYFSGAMGMDIGLEESGIEVLLASEIDDACRMTIERNKPDIALIGDIRDYDPFEVKKKAGLSQEDEIDLIVGGPPCQAFSSAGKRQGFHDERGNVFLTFINHIIALRPRFAVIENVRGLLSAPLVHRPHERRGFGYPPLTPDEEKGGALNHILDMLLEAGYGISFNLYNSANFGAPQVRERVIIICSRDGERLPYLIPTHSDNGLYDLPPWKTVSDAFEDLKCSKHDFVKFPEKRLKYYRMLKPGQYWRDLPEKLHKEALGASYYAGGGKTGFLRRLAWDKPSPTLVTHPAMPATDLAHPTEDRPLSIQEYKCIQQFPKDWVIEGRLLEQYRQIGNAVPISLGRAIGSLLIKYINKQDIHTYPDFPYSRYKDTDDISWKKQILERTRKRRLSKQDFLFES
ncbi:DNA cytosine methyltransferase [bacterium]|nr:DNA cytosine methyltransferase [bacterium]